MIRAVVACVLVLLCPLFAAATDPPVGTAVVALDNGKTYYMHADGLFREYPPGGRATQPPPIYQPPSCPNGRCPNR